MAYRGLTAIGANYLATRLAQELPVEITRVQIGAGTPIGNPGDVSELQNYKLDAKILKKSQENNTLEITIQVVNEDVDQGFYLKEIGVFVNDDTEKLYWYCNEDNAQYIPAKTDSAIAFEIDIKMEVTNIESPIMNWSGKGTWIDKDYLEEALKNHVVNNLTEQSATKALAANQGVVLDNKDVGIMGGRDGKFPLTAATKGNIYLLESTQKYYICINDYDGIQISVPNANFEELSVYTNRSKLDNLFEIIWDKNVYLGSSIYDTDNTIIGDITIPNRAKFLIFDMITPGNDNSLISTIVRIGGSESTYNILVPATVSITGTLNHIKFKISSNKFILVKKASWHILRVTAIKF